MWDLVTHKSKGYGFIAFKTESEAQSVIDSKNGIMIGSRPVRLNWATQRNQRFASVPEDFKSVYSEDKPESVYYQMALKQRNLYNRTVYVGNLVENITGILL